MLAPAVMMMVSVDTPEDTSSVGILTTMGVEAGVTTTGLRTNVVTTVLSDIDSMCNVSKYSDLCRFSSVVEMPTACVLSVGIVTVVLTNNIKLRRRRPLAGSSETEVIATDSSVTFSVSATPFL